MIDLLDISKNNSKDMERIKVIVFEIKINIKSFIARLLKNKLDKAIKIIGKVFTKY